MPSPMATVVTPPSNSHPAVVSAYRLNGCVRGSSLAGVTCSSAIITEPPSTPTVPTTPIQGCTRSSCRAVAIV